MAPVGFEPTNSPGERPKTYALDDAATGIGCRGHRLQYYFGVSTNRQPLIKQDRQSARNVKLRRFRELLLLWKSSNNYIFCIYVCILAVFIHYAKRMRRVI